MIGLNFFNSIPTRLDINGPILSFTTQPVGILTSTNDNATFIGIATATFPIQTPTNPATNTGYISYQWHEVGVGALTNSSIITGAATTTLVLSGLRSLDSGRQFFLRADYIPSAYGANPITVGTARSTGNAINDGLDSNIVTLAIFPTLAISSQPLPQTVSGTRPAIFEVAATTSDSSDSSLSYNWLLNGNLLTNSANVSNSSTNKLTIALPARYDATVHHEIASNSTTSAFTITNTGDFKASGFPGNVGGSVFNGLDPGATLNNDNTRYYDIKFQSDIGTTNYEVEVTNISDTTAAGTFDTGIGVGAITKRGDGFRIWFYRSGEFVCSQPTECKLYVWPPKAGDPTDTAVSGSQSNLFGGLSINVASPSTWVQQKVIATGINYSGTFSITGRMREYSPNKTVDFRIRAVLPNGTTVLTSNSTATGSGARFDMELGLNPYGPIATLDPLSLVIDARFPDNVFTGGINVDSSSASWNGISRSYEGTVPTIATHVRDWSFSLISANKIQARVSHPAANNSPIFSNPVDYNIVSARSILNFESFNGGDATEYGYGSNNLNDAPVIYVANPNISSRTLSIYSPEKDIKVRITLAGAGGASRNGYRGGEGGLSIFTYTLRQNTEYVLKLGAQTMPTGGANGGAGSASFHRGGRVVAVCGGGGGAGTQGRGGDGGGISIAGESGQGRNPGIGGILFATGTLPIQGFFAGGSTTGQPNFTAPTGGRYSSCPPGDYWASQGIAPCNDIGIVQYRSSNGGLARSSASILRGFKDGTGYRNNGGNGSGDNGGAGSGAVGGNAGTGSGSGGGGGSGYSNGEANIITTRLGGNSGTEAYAKFEVIL